MIYNNTPIPTSINKAHVKIAMEIAKKVTIKALEKFNKKIEDKIVN